MDYKCILQYRASCQLSCLEFTANICSTVLLLEATVCAYMYLSSQMNDLRSRQIPQLESSLSQLSTEAGSLKEEVTQVGKFRRRECYEDRGRLGWIVSIQ